AGAVDAEAPLLSVAIPAGLHLTDEHELALGFEQRNGGEVSGVASRAGGFGSGVRAPESGGQIGSVALEAVFIVLPVAVGAAGVAIVLHVEDRQVRLVQQALSAIVHKAQIQAAPGNARGGSRANGQKAPDGVRGGPGNPE